MIYLLASIIGICLASAQALWASAIKTISAGASVPIASLLGKMLLTPKFWLGALLYVISTGVYFILLSKVKFFAVQFTMTGIALLVALAVSIVIFKEHISLVNIAGVVLIFIGIILINYR